MHLNGIDKLKVIFMEISTMMIPTGINIKIFEGRLDVETLQFQWVSFGNNLKTVKFNVLNPKL
jgi:hypothetical protein